jgi:hypothetical protein
MSRVGKKPVTLPAGVTASVQGQTVAMKGPKGELRFTVPELVEVAMEDGAVAVKNRNDSKQSRALWGTSRAQIAVLAQGVTAGFEKRLEINGVGYKRRCRARCSSSRWATATTSITPFPTVSQSRRLGRSKSWSPGSTSNASARRLPKSGISAPRALQGQGREVCG